jgi:mannose-6-phosphate isomerase-like protein (cupin superfamily)
MDTRTGLGEKIRRLRTQAGWSLRELARRSQIDFGTLHRLETGKFVGHVTTHQKIGQALGLSLGELYRETRLVPEPSETPTPMQASEAERFTYDHNASAVLLANQVLEKRMLPQLILLQPGGQTHQEQGKAGSEKWLFVLEGEVEVRIGDRTYPLTPNGTLYFNAATPHQLRNPGATAARCISVTTPVAL